MRNVVRFLVLEQSRKAGTLRHLKVVLPNQKFQIPPGCVVRDEWTALCPTPTAFDSSYKEAERKLATIAN